MINRHAMHVAGAVLAGAVLSGSPGRAAVVLSENFDSATNSDTATSGANIVSTTGGNTWYSIASAAASATNTAAAVSSELPPGNTYFSGKVLTFTNATNTWVIAGFTSTTLQNPGDFIQAKVDFRFVNPSTTAVIVPQLGLFNNSGTPVTQNQFAAAAAGDQIVGDVGFKVAKEQVPSASINRLGAYGVTNTATESGGVTFFGKDGGAEFGTSIGTINTDYNFNNNNVNTDDVLTMTLKLTLAPNGSDLLLDASLVTAVATGTALNLALPQQTVSGAGVLTKSFNELVFRPNSSAVAVDNFEVTSSVPEPAMSSVVGVPVVMGMLVCRRRRLVSAG